MCISRTISKKDAGDCAPPEGLVQLAASDKKGEEHQIKYLNCGEQSPVHLIDKGLEFRGQSLSLEDKRGKPDRQSDKEVDRPIDDHFPEGRVDQRPFGEEIQNRKVVDDEENLRDDSGAQSHINDRKRGDARPLQKRRLGEVENIERDGKKDEGRKNPKNLVSEPE